MCEIFAFVCTPSVTIPAAAPLNDTALPPMAFTAIAINALAPCSPVARSASISRSVGCGEISRASLIRLSVTPAIAEMTATTSCPARFVASRRSATRRMRSVLPTEVPPYF